MKIRKIIAVTAASVITVSALFIANGLFGNPISGFLAKTTARQYIETNYGDLELEIQRAGYNFKFNSYCVFVRSAVSEDTAFTIYVNSLGKVLRDDYEYEVANRFTTWRRLDEELWEFTSEQIGSRVEYDMESFFLRFVEEKEGNQDLMKLEPDMELDIHDPPLPLKADIVIYHEDVSYSTVAAVIRELEAVFREQNIPVSMYGVTIIPLSDKPEQEGQAGTWIRALSVTDFPADLMDADNLPRVIEEYEAERIALYNERYKK